MHDPCIELDITRGLKRKRFRLSIALVCFWEEASDLVMISSIFAIYGVTQIPRCDIASVLLR